MSTRLTIRNLDEAVTRKLRTRADTHGRTLAAEARETLSWALALPYPEATAGKPKRKSAGRSVCQSVRGIWKGRATTDAIMKLTCGD